MTSGCWRSTKRWCLIHVSHLPGFLDSLRGNKEAQRTMSVTCLQSWTRVNPLQPSPALSPERWSGETSTGSWPCCDPHWRLSSQELDYLLNVFLVPSRFVSFLLFFLSSLPPLSCWFDGDGAHRSSRTCVVEPCTWRTWRPLQGKVAKGATLSSVEEHRR